MLYLKIENPGTFDVESLLVLGVTGSRHNEENIGKFGSGGVHYFLTLMRNDIYPIMYIGNCRVEMKCKNVHIDGGTFRQALVIINGKEPNGKTFRYVKDLSYTLEWGELDWNEVGYGIREIIANALDNSTQKDRANNGVSIELVTDAKPKEGHTAVFVPYTEEVADYYKDLPRKFLHFSSKYSPTQTVLPKKNESPCRIYHKGVFVRELEENSIFDYNCPDLTLNESRTSDVYACLAGIGHAIGNKKNKEYLKKVLRRTIGRNDLTESRLSHYSFAWGLKENLIDAYIEEFGLDTVLCQSDFTEGYASKKGYQTVRLAAAFSEVLKTCERVKKDSDVLNHAQIAGLEDMPATPEVKEAFNKVWAFLETHKMTALKDKPDVKCIRVHMDSGSVMGGKYDAKNQTIYISDSLGGLELLQTVLEEVVHHVTGAADGSRDIQDFLFKFLAAFIN